MSQLSHLCWNDFYFLYVITPIKKEKKKFRTKHRMEFNGKKSVQTNKRRSLYKKC